MSKYERGVCPECKVKEGDSRKKILYQCKLCERWFCAKHFEPKLVRIPDYNVFVKYPEVRVAFEKERREDGHPDFAYSLKRIKELDMEEKLYSKLIEDALNRSKAYRKPIPRETEKKGKLYFVKEESPTSPSLDIETRKTKTRKPFPTKKVVGLFLAVMIIGALLWYAPTIISYVRTPIDSSDESSYTKLTLRDLPITEVNATVIEFGDTEYTFDYLMGYLHVYTFLGGSKNYIPHEGDTYTDSGIEIKVSDVGSDYISDYIMILVKPTVQNYSASLYYTKVSMALDETKAVNISSGLINKTKQYWFTYTQVTHPSFSEPKLTIQTSSQSKKYFVIGGFTIREFEIETRVYKIESGYMVIYVKPLY